MVLRARRALPYTELDAEGAAAAASALHVGIVKLESRAFHCFDVIDLNSVQIHGAHLVHRDLQPIKLKNLVRIAGLVFKGHVVLETGAAAADNSHAQRDRHWALHTHDFLDLGTRNGRQIDHKSSWPPLAGVPAKLSTSSLYQNFHTAALPHVPVRNSLFPPLFDKHGRFAYNKMQ